MDYSAAQFLKRLHRLQSEDERKKIARYFKSKDSDEDVFIGVKMGQVFELAKEFIQMPVSEIEKLLESDIHEARAGAVSIMDKVSRAKKVDTGRLKEIFELYMRRHDRINNWDLVDLGCLYMVGSYLFDKPRKLLYEMALSEVIWERRTAILGTCYFIRKGEVDDTMKIAEILLHDRDDLVQKACGWMLRFAGDKQPQKLISFLDLYAVRMPRTALRGAIEKLSDEKRKYYLGMKTADI
jgi:3-methyladenine DNA glycosylase AlkD